MAVGESYFDWPSTGLAACLRAPSSDLPEAVVRNWCLVEEAALAFAASPPFRLGADIATMAAL